MNDIECVSQCMYNNSVETDLQFWLFCLQRERAYEKRCTLMTVSCSSQSSWEVCREHISSIITASIPVCACEGREGREGRGECKVGGDGGGGREEGGNFLTRASDLMGEVESYIMTVYDFPHRTIHQNLQF